MEINLILVFDYWDFWCFVCIVAGEHIILVHRSSRFHSEVDSLEALSHLGRPGRGVVGRFMCEADFTVITTSYFPGSKHPDQTG